MNNTCPNCGFNQIQTKKACPYCGTRNSNLGHIQAIKVVDTPTTKTSSNDSYVAFIFSLVGLITGLFTYFGFLLGIVGLIVSRRKDEKLRTAAIALGIIDVIFLLLYIGLIILIIIFTYSHRYLL